MNGCIAGPWARDLPGMPIDGGVIAPRRNRPLLTAISVAALTLAGVAAAIVITTATSPPPPRPCLEVLMPGIVLTDETIDRGCVHPSGRHITGATYRCADGRRLHADGFRVFGFVGEPLQRGDGEMVGYRRAVSACLAR